MTNNTLSIRLTSDIYPDGGATYSIGGWSYTPDEIRVARTEAIDPNNDPSDGYGYTVFWPQITTDENGEHHGDMTTFILCWVKLVREMFIGLSHIIH